MSTNLPEQVQKQSKEIQALYVEMGAEPKEGDTSEAAQLKVVKTSEEAGETTPPAENERIDAGKSSKKNEGDNDFEQKYKTLQGMYNTELPKLRNQNQDLEGRLQSMEILLAGMGDEKAVQLEVPTGSIVTEGDRDEYGETLDVMRRVSQEELQPLMRKLNSIEASLNNLKTDVIPKVERVYSSQESAVEQQFWNKISAAVPDWESINTNDDFATWLYGTDPMTGAVRQTLLENAQTTGDANRVIYIFKTWMGETGYDNGISETNTAHANNNAELESQVAPGKGRSSSPSGTAEKPSFSREEIATFFNDVARGKFEGRGEERSKIEADIFDAQREGRVVG